ncbi:MAG: FecR domain-containing protein [Bacteroidales bacterium]|nr:FecR domain-containing protein [Bacteroidales bacterium]
MNKEFEHIDLISRVLSGNYTASEKETLMQWIGMSNENKNTFLSYESTWNLAGSVAPKVNFDVNASWDKLNSTILCFEGDQIINTKDIEPVVASRQRFGFYLKRIAAVLVIAFGMFYLLNQKPQAEILTVASLEAIDAQTILPDGTKIFLNQNTKVSYPEVFASNERLLDFKGEGFFEVAHNPEKPMIIETGNLRVKVLGTTFDLINYDESDEVFCFLQTGKVLFYSINPDDGSVVEQIILVPGQKGVYNKVTGSISKESFTGNNFMAWKSGELEFVKTPLSDVFDVLEKAYDIQITSTKKCNQELLTATYHNETIESIFESIRVIYGIDFKIEGKQVVLQ